MALKDLLRDLWNQEKTLKYSRLLELSGMSSDEMVEFRDAWASVTPVRKRMILEKLVELCVDDLELDFDSVFRTCLKDEDEQVRQRATEGLWECDDRSLIRPLIELMLNDPSVKVRATAATSLRKFAIMAQNGKLLPRDASRTRDSLIGTVIKENEDLQVRRRAIEAVACFDFPERDDIIRDAYNSGDPMLKQSSINAMGQSSNPEWLPTVIVEMENEHPAIRYEAACACGQLGEESTAPHLIKLIQDEDVQVQLAAVRALGAVGGPLARQALQRCCKLGDEVLEEAAQHSLSSIQFDDDPLGTVFEA